VGVNRVKTLKFEEGGECMTPPAAMVAPPLTVNNRFRTNIIFHTHDTSDIINEYILTLCIEAINALC